MKRKMLKRRGISALVAAAMVLGQSGMSANAEEIEAMSADGVIDEAFNGVLDEVLEDNITGLFPQSCDETITEVVSDIRQTLGHDKWLNKQENRMEAFIEYIKNYIRKYYNEHKEIQ